MTRTHAWAVVWKDGTLFDWNGALATHEYPPIMQWELDKYELRVVRVVIEADE